MKILQKAEGGTSATDNGDEGKSKEKNCIYDPPAQFLSFIPSALFSTRAEKRQHKYRSMRLTAHKQIVVC